MITKKVDLKNTWYLKTAIIEKECMRSLNNDILEGPKYLVPLVDLISLSDFIFFLPYPRNYSIN